MNSYGGGVLGVNVVKRAPANNPEARWPASTLFGETGNALHGARRCPDLSAATYASEQSAPDWRYFQNDYAALSGGF